MLPQLSGTFHNIPPGSPHFSKIPEGSGTIPKTLTDSSTSTSIVPQASSTFHRLPASSANTQAWQPSRHIPINSIIDTANTQGPGEEDMDQGVAVLPSTKKGPSSPIDPTRKHATDHAKCLIRASRETVPSMLPGQDKGDPGVAVLQHARKRSSSPIDPTRKHANDTAKRGKQAISAHQRPSEPSRHIETIPMQKRKGSVTMAGIQRGTT
ncbi:uncharacterized protein UTRI_06033 [Ustilago trichophora]|uniref:Uncharacterized protein n=1 Tax=Ustilago trichophora TaxID=86804 RepID=A0A5C3EHR0_9BASI|nr:uncharacterized protein UTRI_06033 [Ustilago trichophora]